MPKENDQAEHIFLKILGFRCQNMTKEEECRPTSKSTIQCCLFCEHKEECKLKEWERQTEGPCEKGLSYCYKYFKWRQTHSE